MPKLTREQVIEKVKNRESLKGEDLSGLDLSGADLVGANFTGANLTHTKLSGAALHRAILCDANLFVANLSWADLRGANLSKANLFGGKLEEANLSMANLSDVNLSNAILLFAIFTGANLQGADLRLSQIHHADLSGANLTGVKVHGIWLVNTKLDNIICEWYDYSEMGDGSDIRYPGSRGFEDIVSALEPHIIVTSDAKLDADLLAGLAGLAKALQVLKARVSKVEDTPAGGSAITLKTAEEVNLIPAVIVLFNALVKDKAIDFGALSQDMADLNKIVINDRPLMDLLKDTLWLIDTSQLHYGLLEKFRRGFASMTAEIRGESVSIKRHGEKLHIDYHPLADRPQIEDKSGGTGKEVGKAAVSGTVGGAITKIIEYLLTH